MGGLENYADWDRIVIDGHHVGHIGCANDMPACVVLPTVEAYERREQILAMFKKHCNGGPGTWHDKSVAHWNMLQARKAEGLE